MNNQVKLLFLALLLIPISQLIAQENISDSLMSFHQSRMVINETAMLVLGGWAAGNILIGTYGNFKASGEAKYFHQFNAAWNIVNLGIAAFGYFNAVNSDPSSMTNLKSLKTLTHYRIYFCLTQDLMSPTLLLDFI